MRQFHEFSASGPVAQPGCPLASETGRVSFPRRGSEAHGDTPDSKIHLMKVA